MWPTEQQLKKVSANDWQKLQLSCVSISGRGSFNFKLNNGMTRNLGKNGENLSFVDHKFKYSWEETEQKSIVRKIVYQFHCSQGPSQLGFTRFLNHKDEVLAEAGELVPDQELIEVVLEENERVIGYSCRISEEDPAELHDIRWMISRIDTEIPDVTLNKGISGSAIIEE